jgi:phosphoribosyl-ATP pyrophosphohydrolase/phosphoribosyl-AMP cyclohydrolase
VCHLGTPTCFGSAPPRSKAEYLSFLGELEVLVADRLERRPDESYVARLAAQGTRRIAQKVGEEGVELALAAVTETNDKIVAEAADLLFHSLVLLRQKGLSLADVVGELERRHRAKA